MPTAKKPMAKSPPMVQPPKRRNLDMAELIPKELGTLALSIQDGQELDWENVLLLLTNGVIKREGGVIALTDLGMKAAALARGLELSVVEKENTMQDAEKSMLGGFIRDRMHSLVTHTRTTKDMVAAMAIAAGLDQDRVQQLVNGVLMPFTPEQLSGMAGVLGVGSETLSDLLARDSAHTRRNDSLEFMTQGMLGQLFVNKDAKTGKYRWTIVSSTAFEDRDGEIVSKDALFEDVERADRDGQHGPLLWWHAEGAEIGTCDFNAVTGPDDKFLFESGTFHQDEVALAVAEKAADLGVSIGFRFDPSYRDADGVFRRIRRKERSLLPNNAASNRLTAVVVTKEENPAMQQRKYDAFVGLFQTPEQGHRIAASMAATMKTKYDGAVAAGLRSKEVDSSLEMPSEIPGTDLNTPANDALAELGDTKLVHTNALADRVVAGVSVALQTVVARVEALEQSGTASKEFIDFQAGFNAWQKGIEKQLGELVSTQPSAAGFDAFRHSQSPATATTSEKAATPTFIAPGEPFVRSLFG